jgi:transposase
MKLRDQVQQAWQKQSRRERKIVRSYARGSPDAGLRLRCKIVLALVQGNSPAALIRSRMASSSLVYEVMHRFIDQALLGLADRREDNGEPKVTEEYEAHVLAVVPGSPRKHGYRRPTWTQELLILVLHKRTGIRISQSSVCRLLRVLEIRLGRPKPVVGCPWRKRRKNRRLRAIQRLIDELPADEIVVYADEVDIHLNPKIGPDYMLRGTQKTVLTPGKNQ